MSAVPTAAVTVHRIAAADLPTVGEILFRAFNRVFSQHGYPPPILSNAAGEALVTAYHDYDPESCFVAFLNGRPVGSAFYHRRGDCAGIGPVTVDPDCQGRGIGRLLMERLIDELAECASIRLFQDAFNHSSFALYARLGFEVRDVMAVLRAEPGPRMASRETPGRICRQMDAQDLDDVVSCDRRLTGMDRPGDIEYLRDRGPAFVLESRGATKGYAVSFAIGDNLFLGPAAAGSQADLGRLVNAVIEGASARVVTVRTPATPGALLTGLLNSGFRIRTVGTYMVRGRWEPPRGIHLAALFPEAL